MSGTCLEVPPQGEQDDDLVVFSFHSDIQNVAAISELSLLVSQTITKSLGAWVINYQCYLGNLDTRPVLLR